MALYFGVYLLLNHFLKYTWDFYEYTHLHFDSKLGFVNTSASHRSLDPISVLSARWDHSQDKSRFWDLKIAIMTCITLCKLFCNKELMLVVKRHCHLYTILHTILQGLEKWRRKIILMLKDYCLSQMQSISPGRTLHLKPKFLFPIN